MDHIIASYQEPIQATLSIPPSKSHTQRAILLAMMASTPSVIHNILPSPDSFAMIQAIENFGANVQYIDPTTLIITGCGGKLSSLHGIIDAKGSGQVLRFAGAFAALLPTCTVITGDMSVRHNRPIAPLMHAIQQLGGESFSLHGNDTAPFLIKGPITGGNATIDGSCSQAVSGLLLACSFLPTPTTLSVQNVGEKPWIQLTLSWMDKLGMSYEAKNLSHFVIHGRAAYKGFEETIPGDMSSVAFPLAAALLTKSHLRIENLDLNGVQGDAKLIDVLSQMGAIIDLHPQQHSLSVTGKNLLQGGVIDVNDYIDALPILSVLGCFGTAPLQLVNGKIARKKESDRIHAMTQELKKMGASIIEQEDGMIILPSLLTGTTVYSHQDHRVAMALSIAGLCAQGTTRILDTACIKKSYPNFVASLQRIGFSLQEITDETCDQSIHDEKTIICV